MYVGEITYKTNFYESTLHTKKTTCIDHGTIHVFSFYDDI